MQASEPPDGDEFAGVVPPTLPALFADLKKAPGQLLDLVIYIKSKAPEVDPEAVAISVLEAAAKAQVEAVRLAHKAREFDYTSITNEAKELLPDLTQLDRPINLGNVPEEQLPLARRYHALLIKLGATLADQPRFVDTAATRLRNALAVFLHRGSPKLVFLESRLRPLDKVFEYGQERGVDKEWSHAAVLAMALGLSGYLARKIWLARPLPTLDLISLLPAPRILRTILSGSSSAKDSWLIYALSLSLFRALDYAWDPVAVGRASETEGKKWRLVKLVLLIWLQRGGRQWLLEKVLLPLSRKLAKLAATRPKPVAVAFAESECTESSKETLTSISNLAAASNASDPETPPVLPATEDVPTESSPSEEPLPPLPTLQPPPKQTPMPTAPSFSLLPTDMPEHPDSKSEKPKPFAFNGFDNGPETPMRKPAKPFIERKARKMDLE